MDKSKLISVYQHTITYCSKQKFKKYDAVKYDLTDEQFDDINILANAKPFDKPADIIVENCDSFEMARKLSEGDNLTMVLNLASDYNSGGGVRKGSRAQEEDLYRKSNYYQANNPKLYPLNSFEVIYSPLVHVIKNENYVLLQNACPVSCLAVAALRNPKLTEDKKDYHNSIDSQLMLEKIEMIFKVAILHNHHNIVLGALGCGAFHNPPYAIAVIFKDAVEKYKHYFKTIGFAILSPLGNNNFDIFTNIFC